MFRITESKTPVLFRQPQAVQTLAQQFNSLYTNQRSVQVRVEWGKFLNQIQKGDLNCVNTKGEPVENTDPRKVTFETICHELGIGRSSAYNYINEYITAQTYPQVIRDAAAEAGLNLALPHVQAAYGEMTAKGLPKDPSALELKGIIAELQDAKPNKTAKPRESAQERFQRLLKEAFEFAKNEKLTPEVVTATLESEIAASFGMPGARVTREKHPIYKVAETSG
jgi:hypothetical protein